MPSSNLKRHVRDYQAQHPELSYAEARRAVMAGHESTQESVVRLSLATVPQVMEHSSGWLVGSAALGFPVHAALTLHVFTDPREIDKVNDPGSSMQMRLVTCVYVECVLSVSAPNRRVAQTQAARLIEYYSAIGFSLAPVTESDPALKHWVTLKYLHAAVATSREEFLQACGRGDILIPWLNCGPESYGHRVVTRGDLTIEATVTYGHLDSR